MQINKNGIFNRVKIKNLALIFILFLLIALAGGLAVFLTKEKDEPAVNGQASLTEKQAEPAVNEPDKAMATSAKEKIVVPEKIKVPETVNNQREEKINAVVIISGAKYEAAVKAGSSAYDLMNLLKAENKINFLGKDYSGLGFFVEEINGVKNNPAGENWIYYINSQPAQAGISNYLININDIIEWKYEKQNF